MISEPLLQVLEATGYLAKGEPAPGVRLGPAAGFARHGRVFRPDASWRGPSALTVYFRYEDRPPEEERVSLWHREVWNEGFSPLLWIVSPDRIDLYNGFGRPTREGEVRSHLLHSFCQLAKSLDQVDRLVGRFVMETGEFWRHESRIDRRTAVDHQLLQDLAYLERDLIEASLARPAAQALIGQSIFAQYLVDRRIVSEELLEDISGRSSLQDVLRDTTATRRLHAWLAETFNGDMFPPEAAEGTEPRHQQRVAEFLGATDPISGQKSLFPYQFDVIPVELISLIYEQFAHAEEDTGSRRRVPREAADRGVHYTRLPVVTLVLDEIMHGLTGTETVLDLTCGSGVFLVESLRRLVRLRAGGKSADRSLIRSILHNQIHGVDISEAAIRVAAFSLYLAALELDSDPQPLDALRFEPLIGSTLHVADARNVELQQAFDVIVGNPPWTFRGSEGTAQRRRGSLQGPAQPRGESLDFVKLATHFGHSKTRFGMVVSAMPFFSGSQTGISAVREVVELLAPVTLVNLASHRGWLFPRAKMPAATLFGRHRSQPSKQMTIVQIPWTPAGPKAHTFEITPSNIRKLLLGDFEDFTMRAKCAALGGRRDLLLLEKLLEGGHALGDWLEGIGAELRDGLILGRPEKRTAAATDLRGLEFLQTGDLLPFRVPAELERFQYSAAQWPRSREVYRAPLLLIKETIARGRSLCGEARPIVAVADRDLVFSDAYFGASFPKTHELTADLAAAILSSSLTSWFLLMTASEFGLWKRRLLRNDIARVPVPKLAELSRSPKAKRILQIAAQLGEGGVTKDHLDALDSAVCELYELDDEEQLLINDGLFRASWEWKEGRLESTEPARSEDLRRYAGAFLSVLNGWLSARRVRRMDAEVIDLPSHAPLRVVRFVLEESAGPSTVHVIRPQADLMQVLSNIGDRLGVELGAAIIGQRELRVHGRAEVVVIKPAARRHWLAAAALDDADAVVAESIAGGKREAS